MERIAFCIIATNAYFTLGLRFLNRFHFLYTGDARVSFYFFSNHDPAAYLPSGIDMHYRPVAHKNWTEGVNSKPHLMLSLLQENEQSGRFDYLYYVDADTDIIEPFDESWFHSDLLGLEHYMNKEFIKPEDFPFDRFTGSASYIPLETKLRNRYYHACFYGGHILNMQKLCEVMVELNTLNAQIGHEPIWNDESLLNYCFHFSPPFRTLHAEDSRFVISDKGGMQETRNPDLDIEAQKVLIREYRDQLFKIENGVVRLENS